MIDDLLDVSRITRGKVDLQKERISLATVIELAVEASQPIIESYDHRLSITLPERPVDLEVDPSRMAQVLSNLLNNAAKYTDFGGQIDLSAELRGREITIRVRDNGMGISPELLPRVFDLFTQADQTLSRSRGGLGIGLTLVRSLVESHGGRVSAQSPGLGQGSEFVVWLPVAGDRMSNDGYDAPSPPGARPPRRRVLVVDDNESNAASLGILLRALGQDVDTAYDGPSAIELAHRLQPDVILLDIGLPGIDGYEVARQCRARSDLQTVILVAMTGYGQHDDRARSREAGFNAHLVKPVKVDELRLLLEDPSRVQP
jgi:CheY-like chemotaxis protein/two-component sensor histidine kinase